MKLLKSKALLLAAIAGSALFALSSAKAQTLTVNQGDLLLSFYQYNPNNTAGPNTYVFNLGSSATWLNNTSTFSLIGNIGADLVTAFGENWATDPTLRMGIVGGYTSQTTNPGIDPSRTVYISKGLTTFNPGSTTAPVVGSTPRGALVTNISGNYTQGMMGEDLNGGTVGAIVSTSNANDYAQYNPPTTLTYFGAGVDPNTSLNNIGTSTSDGGYTVLAGLDLYRILHTATGADLTAGLSQGDATVGTGQYIGTFTLDADGNVRMDAVPEPSTYALIALAGIALAYYRFRRRTA